MSTAEPIVVRKYKPEQKAEWKAFLQASNNGTLYHDLEFLAYHPPERFHEHHLMFYQGTKLLALLPGAIITESDGRRLLKSPYGSSVGGLVMSCGTPTDVVLDLVKILQSYARDIKLNGIEMWLGPNVYLKQPNDLQAFCFMVNGFQLVKRSLQYMLPLSRPGMQLPEKLFSTTKQYDIRAGLKNGCHPREVDISRLKNFYHLLHETYQRLGAVPTHKVEELEKIFHQVPGRARLFLCMCEGRESAGVVIFMLNERVASAFYICSLSQKSRFNSVAVLIAHIAEQMAEEDVSYLDLGPSASESHFNAGVIFFKEGLGAQGFCRDAWHWQNEEIIK